MKSSSVRTILLTKLVQGKFVKARIHRSARVNLENVYSNYLVVASDFSRGNGCCAGGSGGGYLGELWRLGLAAAIRVTRAAHLQILQLLQLLAGRLGFKPT